MSPAVFVTALIAVVIFGGSAIAAKVAVSTIAALDVAILRTIIGGAIALPLALMLRIRLPVASTQRWLLAISGFCGFVAFPLLFTFGVMLTSANHATMVLAVLPMTTGAIAMLWDRQWPASIWWLGCAVAFAGEIILIYEAPVASVVTSTAGDLLVLLANVFASLGYVAGARLQRSGYSAKGTTFWGISLFALLILPFAWFMLDFDALAVAGQIAWTGVLYQAIGVTIIAYMLWYWALGTGGIARVGLFQFLQPVSGVILAWLVLSEGISASFAIASLLIICGVFIAFRAR
ncbi:MAG: drug/metabolite transporter (DMT)-like permease [Planctomycetota bacterium]|jgi:drug/metabolite transporter (DMT)-like permease